MKSKVKWFDNSKGFGFIEYNANEDIFVHYSEIKEDVISEFVDVMKENNVSLCLYGHLHGNAHNEIKEGKIEGIEFKMVSCDYTNFELIKINM